MTIKKSKSTLITNIEKTRDRIAKERDYLRNLINDTKSICDSCDEAIDYLDVAADKLSEYL